MSLFEPTLQAAQARLSAVQPDAYARTRNALEGAVTRLSPYLTHGFLSLADVYLAVHKRHPLNAQHKLVFELGWRGYYRHVWSHLGQGIEQSLRKGLHPETVYQQKIPDDFLEARTGIPAIDLAVRSLYETGYVHNHARMWLASYLVHLRKVHWHSGAQWMLAHLLDGDLASNHLSWQWVAGTNSNKPYLFNADNIAKYAPVPWHSPGTVLDTSYEIMHQYALSAEAIKYDLPPSYASAGMGQPDTGVKPLGMEWQKPDATVVTGRDVWLVHPWSLGTPLHVKTTNSICIGIGLIECHSNTPWSTRRWNFVREGMHTQAERLWWGSVQEVVASLSTARSVQWQSEPHVNGAMTELQNRLERNGGCTTALALDAPELFKPVPAYCASFAQWWKKTGIQLEFNA